MSSIHECKDSESKDAGVNIKVVVRCRPLSTAEKTEGTASVVAINPQSQQVNVRGGSKKPKKAYTFDKVYGQYSTQQELFDQSVVPIINEVLSGFNCTVFAYGQTGTGKTYTMEGDLEAGGTGTHAGIIPRSINRIFTHLKSTASEYSVRVSFLELYNEQLEDLMYGTADELAKTGSSSSGGSSSGGSSSSHAGAGGSGRDSHRLRIVDDSRKGTMVNGLEEVLVHTAEEALSHVDAAIKKRRVAETMLNKASSRSHCIFSLTIHTKETTPEGEDLLKVGKLNLVDLAGSECVGRSGAKHERAREAGNINQSLLTLGRVITALVEHTPHIPYRDSKLTRLLQDSLGGKTKTCVIATLSPSVLCIDETVSTLDYANRAKNIKNRPVLNQKMTKRALIKEYSQEIERLKEELKCARDKSGVYLPTERYEQMQLQLSSQSGSLAELESVLDTHKAAKEALEAKAAAVTAVLEQATADIDGLHSKIDRQAAVEKDNRDASNAFVTEAGGRLDELSSTLQTFREAQVGELDGLVASIDDLAGKRADESAVLTSSIDDIKSHIDEFVGSTSGHTETFLESGSEEYGELQDQVTGFQTSFPDMLTKSGNTIKTQLDGMSELIKKQQEQLNEWASLAKAFTATLKASTDAFVGAQTQAVDCAKTAADEAMSAVVDELEAAKLQVCKLNQERKTRTTDTVSNLVKMLQQFSKEEGEAADASTASLHAVLDSAGKASTAVTDSAKATADSMLEATTTWATEQQATAEVHDTEVETHKTAVDTAILEGESFREQVATTIDSSLSKASGDVKELMGGFAGRIEAAQTRLASFTADLNTNLASARDCVNDNSETVYKTIKDGEAAFGEACTTVKGEIDSAKEKTMGLEPVQTTWVDTERAKYTAFVAEDLKMNVPTGSTPVKRKYQVSDDIDTNPDIEA